jgi:hypothetical protein
MRKRAVALLVAVLVLAGCGESAQNNNRPDPPRLRPNSNVNPDTDSP